MALKSGETSTAPVTVISLGRRVFTARGSRSQGMVESVRKLARYTLAWTPASVRPAPVHLTLCPTTFSRAFSRVSSTVRALFWICQP